MPRQRGLTLGKFLPLHKGHELLLETALNHCDELRVLIGVTPDDSISFDIRRQWIEEFTNSLIRGGTKTVEVHADPESDPFVAKDAQGTVIDEAYWQRWIEQNQHHLAVTHLVFTSDRYGAEIARRTGTRWFPVDPDRDLFPVSATKIRADLAANFHHLSDVARPYLGLTIAIVGAESTGKSVLAKRLAKEFNTTCAPEWGRIISEAKPDLDEADFSDIVHMQSALIRKAQINGNGLSFTDTEAITTALFAPIYLRQSHPLAELTSRNQRLDLYILLAPTVAHIQDGTRVLDEAGRQCFHDQLVERLKSLDRNFVIVDPDGYEARYELARHAVQELLEKDRRI